MTKKLSVKANEKKSLAAISLKYHIMQLKPSELKALPLILANI